MSTSPASPSPSPSPSPSSSDCIERSIHIKAPRSRVWQALSNAEEYGLWFGANLQGQRFAPGRHVRGNFTIPGHEDAVCDALIERVKPETLMSYRWHPHVDPSVDTTGEQRTLVTFTLHEVGDGTLLKVLESGFDAIPPHRRLPAISGNTQGWEWQLKNIERYAAAG